MTDTKIETPKVGKDIELLNQSLKYYKEAQKIANEINDIANEAAIYGKIGKVYHQLNELKQAIHAYEESVTLFGIASDSSSEIDALIELAKLQELDKRRKDSQESFKKAAVQASNKNKSTKEEYCYGQLGISHLEDGDFKEAFTWFDKALVLSRKINEKKNESVWLYHSGRCSQKIGDYKTAIDMHSDSIIIAKEISDIRREALNYGELGRINATLSEHLAAISTYESAILLFEFLDEKELEARFLIEQADVYYEIGSISQARKAYEKAGRIIRKIRDKKGFENVLGKIGIAYLNEIKDYKTAIKYFQKATDIASSIEEEQDYIKWLGKLAESEAKDSQYTKSNEDYNEAIRLAEEQKDFENKALLILGLGSNYYSMGDIEGASEEFTRALKTIEKSKSEPHKLTILLALSEVFLDLKNNEKALIHYEQALTTAQNLNLPRKQLIALTNLGEVNKRNKNYKKALDFHKKALKIAQTLEDQKEEHTQLGEIGVVYFVENDIKNAKEYVTNALTIAKEIEDRVGRGKWTGYLGNIYLAEKDLMNAVESYEEAVKIFKKIGLRREEISWMNTLAATYLNKEFKNYDKSIEINLRSLDLSARVEYPEIKLKIADELGQAYFAKNELVSAIKYFKMALDLSSALGEIERQGSILSNLGQAYLSSDKISEAIKAFESALSMITDEPFFNLINLIGLGKCYLRLNDMEKANNFIKKSNKIITKLGDKKAEETHYGLIGEAYSEIGRIKDAREFFVKAMELADTDSSKVKWHLRIANLLFDEQKYNEAHNEFLIILKSIKSVEKVDQANLYVKLGRTLDKIAETKKQSSKAIDYLKKGVEIAQELDLQSNLAEWEKEIGDIFTRNGEYEEAESHYTVALEQIKQLGEEKLEQDILSSFGDLYSKKNEAQKAIKLFKQALSISKSNEESKILKEKIKVLEMNIES